MITVMEENCCFTWPYRPLITRDEFQKRKIKKEKQLSDRLVSLLKRLQCPLSGLPVSPETWITTELNLKMASTTVEFKCGIVAFLEFRTKWFHTDVSHRTCYQFTTRAADQLKPFVGIFISRIKVNCIQNKYLTDQSGWKQSAQRAVRTKEVR